MTQPEKTRIAQIANLLAKTVALFIALLLPIGYFTISYQHAVGSLEAETQINSRIISELINENPELWRFEKMRLEELLKRRPMEGLAEGRRVMDLDNKVVAEYTDPLASPLITQKFPLKDSGVTVATIEISRSLRPILLRTGIVALLSILTGLAVFIIIRVLPFRALIEAEQSLRESEARFRELAELLPQPIFEIDREGNITFGNNRALHLLGYSAQELSKGLSTLEILDRDDRSRFLDLLQGQDNCAGTEYLLRKKTGETVPTMIYAGQIIRNGKVSGLRVIIIDLTEQKRAEEDKYRLQNQLRQSQKLEAVGTLAAGIAHEFNNLLMAIVAGSSLIKMQVTQDSKFHEILDMILNVSERGKILTSRLLSYSRQQEPVTAPVNINLLIENFNNLMRNVLPENIVFNNHLSPDELIVMADSNQIEQVLMNLFTNSRDAMPAGGILTFSTETCIMDDEFIKCHGFGSPGCYALLTVADNGSGMDETTLERVFEPFFTTKDIGRGTGLGLSLVYGIIQQHAGFIHIASEPGRGTSCSIYLPMTSADSTPKLAAPVENLVNGNEGILLVEDNEAVRGVLSQVLTHYGYRVIEALDGQDGVDKFRQHQHEIDLLLSDVVMPNKNGPEAYDEMKKVRGDLKAIFMSGYAATVHGGMGTDKIDYLVKPVLPKQLLKKVREVLSRQP